MAFLISRSNAPTSSPLAGLASASPFLACSTSASPDPRPAPASPAPRPAPTSPAPGPLPNNALARLVPVFTVVEKVLGVVVRSQLLAPPPSRPFVLHLDASRTEQELLDICIPEVARRSLMRQLIRILKRGPTLAVRPAETNDQGCWLSASREHAAPSSLPATRPAPGLPAPRSPPSNALARLVHVPAMVQTVQTVLGAIVRAQPLAQPPSRPYVLSVNASKTKREHLSICTPEAAGRSLVEQAVGNGEEKPYLIPHLSR